ncbi:MAG: anhydro-N-acetylmuramic acid kinase [Rubrivivax sp.]
MGWFIGLMSGTSLDGVDAVLAWHGPDSPLPSMSNTHSAPPGRQVPQAAHHLHLPMPADLRAELLALNRSGDDEIHRAALAANALVKLYAEAVGRLLQPSGLQAQDIEAIGAHGQTVRHRPGEFDGTGYTVQLMNGALLAETCGIDVVCDFRSRDVAAGGQGAPLVPAFHAACFAEPGRDVAVLNLGGIANLSLLGADGSVGGFDTGPGNVLMDLWCQRHLKQPFDADGAWAAGGTVEESLLQRWLDSEPYFHLMPPKSSGRDLFNIEWLDSRLAGTDAAPRDLMATLLELTARNVVQHLLQHAPRTTDLLVCGGGANNVRLMARLHHLLGAGVRVSCTAVDGLPPDQVEAMAFAWLAAANLARVTGNHPAVTGAKGPRVLGSLYPAQ